LIWPDKIYLSFLKVYISTSIFHITMLIDISKSIDR